MKRILGPGPKKGKGVHYTSPGKGEGMARNTSC